MQPQLPSYFRFCHNLANARRLKPATSSVVGAFSASQAAASERKTASSDVSLKSIVLSLLFAFTHREESASSRCGLLRRERVYQAILPERLTANHKT